MSQTGLLSLSVAIGIFISRYCEFGTVFLVVSDSECTSSLYAYPLLVSPGFIPLSKNLLGLWAWGCVVFVIDKVLC